jgi:murein DD-endopeptidase MepM/ murein hydrolase activator NlpD
MFIKDKYDMAENHILLLPRKDYFKWVKATQRYVLAFGVNITPDPPKAGSKDNVTIAVVPDGYPNEGDIVGWLRARFPNTRIDAISVNTPDDLRIVLNDRVAKKQRYGDRTTAPRTGDTVSLPISGERIYLFWPTDYVTITQAFGVNPEIYSKWGLPGHEGLDFRAPLKTNVYACAGGEVFKVENDPDVHPYGKHIRIRHPNGYRTVYAHLTECRVSVGQIVKTKEIIGKADSTGNSSGSHLHLTLKRDGATERGETNYRGDIIDPTPFMVYPHQEVEIMNALKLVIATTPTPTTFQSQFQWTRPCLIGLNARDDGSMGDADFLVVKTAQLEAIKIRENTSSNDIAQLRQIIPNIFIMARIAYDMGQTKVTSQEWVGRMSPEIDRLYRFGIQYFEIHQSPNLQMYGWNYSWYSGFDFSRWWMDIVGLLRDPFPEAKFGFPGVSPGGQVSGQRLDAKVFLEQADESVGTADWIGVNCFWSNETEMSLQTKGAYYEYVRERFPNKLLFITEFANVNDMTNSYVKGNEYVKYYQSLREKPGIGAAFSQVMSSIGGYGQSSWRTEDGKLTQIPYRVGRRAL